MRRHAQNSNESSYGSTESAMARAERASAHRLSRNSESDYLHPVPQQPYNYPHSQIAIPDRYDYGEDEVNRVLRRLPSQERVPQSNFQGSAGLTLDDPLQRWKLIEEDRDYIRDDGRDYRRHYASQYDRQAAALSSMGVPRHSPPPYHHDDYGISSTFVPSYPHHGRDVAIVSPVFDEYGEQSFSSRNSLQRYANEWDDLKPPPLSSNDHHLYHRNHYQREEEESYHRRFSSDHSYGSRDYHARASTLSVHSRNPPVPTTKMMEISPGSFVRLRGADETYQAVMNDFYAPCQCMICSSNSPSKYHRKGDEEPLFCIQDADFFLCPNCKSICPLEDDATKKRSDGGGGVGLGFTLEMLIQIQEEIVSNRSTAR